MISETELAEKKLDLLLKSNIGRAELIYHIYHHLDMGVIKFKLCCEKLLTIDPIEQFDRFLDVVYGLYIYIHPDIATETRCLKSESEFGIKASRLIEKRFTNYYSSTYGENSSYLIKYTYAALHPIFENKSESNNESNNKFCSDLTLRSVYWIIKTEKEKLDQSLQYYDNPLSIFSGIIVSVFGILEQHTIETYEDAFNFVDRLKSIILMINDNINFMEKQKSLKGVDLPRTVAQQSYDMIQKFIKIEPQNHDFMKKFYENITAKNISHDIYSIALEFLSDSVYTGMYHLGDWINEFFLEDDDITNNTNNTNNTNDEYISSEYSVCCDKNRGKQYYEYCLKYHTTTDFTPEKIHQIGLDEVERISNRILECMKEHDNDIDNFSDAIDRIRKITYDRTNIYPDTPDGETQIVSDFNRINRSIKTYLPSLFDDCILESDITSNLEYKFTPEHQKHMMPGAYYYDPSFDGKIKGAFYVNLRSDLLRFGMKTLMVHEAIPGHHLQKSALVQSSYHPIRKIEFYNQLNSYVEGWALYCERLYDELNFYEGLSLIGHLMDEMLRAARLVIDTGIHHYGWDRQKALNYMNEVCPYPPKTNEIEIDRYISWPGQATSYKIGQLKIIKTRDDNYSNNSESAKTFNTKLINDGPVPLDLI